MNFEHQTEVVAEGVSTTTDESGTAATTDEATAGRITNRIILILIAILAGACLLYFAALSPETFGVYHDDGIYVTTGKALATGNGYRIISLPYEPAQTKYPPFYPFLLSLIWRAYSKFPQNLIPMMLLSIASAGAFLATTWRYLVRHRYATNWLALIVVALAAINWRTLVLATSLYSEMVYAFLAVLALFVAEEHEQQKQGWLSGVIVGVIIGLAFMTRSLGLTLLIALAGYTVLRKQWKKYLVPLATGSAFVIGWLVWCHLNRTNSQGANVAYYTDYFGHINQVITSLHLQNATPKWLVLLGLLGRNTLMFAVVTPLVIVLGVDYGAVPYFGFVCLFILAGFIRQCRKEIRLLHIYVVCYIVMASFVPFPSYDRYLMPLLPFVLLFVVTEAVRLVTLTRKELTRDVKRSRQVSAALIALVLLISCASVLYNHVSEIYERLGRSQFQKTAKPAPQDVETIEWVKENTNPSDILVCYLDPIYYLYTGRKTSRSLPMEEWVDWRKHQTSLTAVENLIFRTLDRDKGRYLIVTSTDFEQEDQTGEYRKILGNIIAAHPERFTPVFSSTDGLSKIFRVEDSK